MAAWGCPNVYYKLFMLLTSKREKDEALVYHLNKIDDWVVYGSVGFRCRTRKDRIKSLFFKLIRALERGNKGEFVVRFEGDNRTRERHFHFLMAQEGLVTKELNSINALLNKRIKDLSYLIDEKGDYLYPELKSCSPKLVKYDPSLGAKGYISKKADDEVERLEGKGLDSCVDGYDWKMSPSLRKRIKNINTLDISHY